VLRLSGTSSVESGAESAGERIAVAAREHKRSARYTYLADLPKPVKMGLPDYNLLETQVETVIAEKFGLALPAPPEVKSADLAMLKYETFSFSGLLVISRIFSKSVPGAVRASDRIRT
jgi:hypothetical protein